jgi:hypothetical protein
MYQLPDRCHPLKLNSTTSRRENRRFLSFWRQISILGFFTVSCKRLLFLDWLVTNLKSLRMKCWRDKSFYSRKVNVCVFCFKKSISNYCIIQHIPLSINVGNPKIRTATDAIVVIKEAIALVLIHFTGFTICNNQHVAERNIKLKFY